MRRGGVDEREESRWEEDAKMWLGGAESDRENEVIRSVIQTNVQSQAERLPRRVDSIAMLTLFLPIRLLCRLLY